jgi:hypothetical protein
MPLGALMLVRSPLTGAGVSVGAALGATLPCAAIAKTHRYAWAKTPTVVQLNLEGPFDLFYLSIELSL